MVDWEYFRKVRKLKVPAWLAAHGITNYEQFVKYLAISGIKQPPEHEVRHLFQEPKKPVIITVAVVPVAEVPLQEDASATEQSVKRNTKRKRTAGSDEQSEPSAS